MKPGFKVPRVTRKMWLAMADDAEERASAWFQLCHRIRRVAARKAKPTLTDRLRAQGFAENAFVRLFREREKREAKR